MGDRFEGEPLVSDLAGEADVIELVEMFISELPDRVDAMQQSIQASDLNRLRVLAHQLKGSAGSYGFPTIGDVARDVESAVKQEKQLTDIKSAVDELADLCRRARSTPQA